MRMIDADELKKCIEESTWNNILDLVDEQPTAFDKNKVIEQLEENAIKMSECKTERPYTKKCGSEHRYYKAIGTHKAIDIVKAGGVE